MACAATAYANAIEPLRGSLGMPEKPDPSPHLLRPYPHGWNPLRAGLVALTFGRALTERTTRDRGPSSVAPKNRGRNAAQASGPLPQTHQPHRESVHRQPEAPDDGQAFDHAHLMTAESTSHE